MRWRRHARRGLRPGPLRVRRRTEDRDEGFVSVALIQLDPVSSGTVTLSNLALNVALGLILGIIPNVLTKPKVYSRLAVDVSLGIAGGVAMACFLAPLHLRAEATPFAEPGLLTGLGSVFAIALGRLVG